MPVPLPPSFGIRAAPETAWEGEVTKRRSVLIGGRPRRWIAVSEQTRTTIDALLRGESVGDAGPGAGDVARRLIAIGAATARPPSGGPAPSSVVAVIPAHNAAATLGSALAGLQGVGEVVVVDDGSTDETAAVARAGGARVIRHEVSCGPAAARNTGISSTDHDLVLLIDADAEPEVGWIEPLLAHLADPVVGGVAPRVRARSESTALSRYEAVAGPLDLGPVGGIVRPDGVVPFVSTTALLLRRSAWEAVGGFAEQLRFGEDLDLAWRLAAHGRPLLYEPAATVWHGHRPRLRAHLVNRFRYGTAGGPLARRHRGFPRAAAAPPLLSAAFAAGVLGSRRAGLALATVSTATLAWQLREVGLSARHAGRRSLESNADATRSLAAGASRPWMPLALVAVAVFPRARAPVSAALVARSFAVNRRSRPDLTLGSWVVLRFLDDLAFSAGVIRGCIDARTPAPLLPARRTGPCVEQSVLGEEVSLP